ncbi:MAG: hypothetical protein ACFFCM_19000 [Promethearchaeota archaeon]
MRIKYYIISILLGIIYLVGYMIFLDAYSWSPRALVIVDIVFLLTSYSLLSILIYKDIVDEIHLLNGKSPVGGTYIEHGPFIFILSAVAIFSIFAYAENLWFKILLVILSVFDGFWDIFQDYRSKSLR